MGFFDWLSGYYGPEKNRFLRLNRDNQDRAGIGFFIAMILVGGIAWLFWWK